MLNIWGKSIELTTYRKPASILLCSVISLSVKANTDIELYEEIKQADATFFKPFNECDIEIMSKMFSQDLEFYHDIAGVSGYESTMQVTRNNRERNLGLVRTILLESLVVYPVKNLGAIRIGEHQFCHEVNRVNDCGTYGFTHVWNRVESGWVVYRIASFGH